MSVLTSEVFKFMDFDKKMQHMQNHGTSRITTNSWQTPTFTAFVNSVKFRLVFNTCLMVRLAFVAYF